MKKNIFILGAGLSGLTCAYELVKKGFGVIVIEKKPYVGGLAATYKQGKFYFDTGPHRWFTKNDEVDYWFRNLMKDQFLSVPRLTHIFFKGKYLEYPIKAGDALKAVGPIFGGKAVFDFLLTKAKGKIFPKKIVTMEDGYINQFGPTLYRLFFEQYNKKLWGYEAKKLSADWISQRSRGFSIFTVLRNMIFPQKIVSFVDKFMFPKMGIGRICERLKKTIEESGGKILLDASIQEIKTSEKGTYRVIVSHPKQEEVKGGALVSSIPIDELISLVRPAPPRNVINAAKKLVYRDGVFVSLFVNKQKVMKSNWIYVQDPKIGFVRFSETGTFSKFMSPKGCNSLVFEFACNFNDAVWKKNDQEMIEWAKKDFVRFFKLVKEKDIIGGKVIRLQKTYPTYILGYKNLLLKIKDYLYSHSNLYLIGRNGMFRYNNMDHAVLTGILAAKNIIAGKKIHDVEAVNTEKEYHEEKRVK